jgi:hypothetical protein
MFVSVDLNDEIDFHEDINLEEKASFEDVIKFILNKNNITLNGTKNIKFTYISYSSEDYAYYRTAYDKKLI